MSNEQLRTVVWGRHGDAIYVGFLETIIRRGDERTALDHISGGTWTQAVDAVGMERLNDLFGSVLDELWDESEFENDFLIGERPPGWIPDGLIDTTDDRWSGYGVVDEADLDLPEEFFEFGSGGSHVMRSDWWTWRPEDIESLRLMATKHGLNFVENQALIDRCLP